jgi:antirestriction protein ArdC
LHSTGHKSRLNRPGIVETHFFGDEIYSKEELVAEKGAAMICGISGIENKTIKNSASYIQSWLGKLKDDKKLVVHAAAAAQKAADFILGKAAQSRTIRQSVGRYLFARVVDRVSSVAVSTCPIILPSAF